MRISDWSSDVCSSDLGVADRLGAADALGDILPRHLEVDAAGVAAFGAVHGEEVLHLRQHAVEGPRLIAARRLDGIAVHRVAGPRTEERRVGKECVSTCRAGWSPYP